MLLSKEKKYYISKISRSPNLPGQTNATWTSSIQEAHEDNIPHDMAKATSPPGIQALYTEQDSHVNDKPWQG